MNSRFLFFFGIFLSLNTAFAQSDINQLDAEGNRHGVWKKTFEGSKQLRYEGTFEHGKEIGTFKFYCEACKTQPMVVREFNGKDDISEVKYYTIKGKLAGEGKMKGNDRIGEWLFYPEKAKTVLTREQYKDGKLHGKKITYYPDGKITEETNYVNGLMEGVNTYFSPDGILIKKLQYKNDLLVGEAFYYDANGNISIEGHYKNDKKDGLWKYYKNGKVELEETYPMPLKRAEN